jgi:perosamine synthetase
MIPVNEPILDGRERERLIECIDSGWISSDGPFVEEFEEAFSSYIGVQHGVAVCSGTAALETALYAAGIGQGDVIVIPTFTIISCALAALRLGAVPLFVDIDPKTWCMDPAQFRFIVERAMEGDIGVPRAVMPVHIYGHPVHMDPILETAEEYGLLVIEDAAEAHGAEYRSDVTTKDPQRLSPWKRCGSKGHVSAFSFYANKIITTGEGGMVLTDSEDMARRARAYRNLCFRPDRRFYHTEAGYNFRMTNLQAAVGLSQLERIDAFIDKKRRTARYYRENLSDLQGVRFQTEEPWARSVYWMNAIELDPSLGIDAETLRQRLSKKGIGTRPFFVGLHAQPVLIEMGLISDTDAFPKTDHATRYGCYLPSGLALTEAQTEQVCRALRAVLE